MTAALLLIGNELLSGKVQEQNLLPLAKMLRSLGIALRRVVTVPDDIDLIAAEVRALAASHQWLFTSGGVGPTHDDVTLQAVAQAFDCELARDPAFVALVQELYGDRVKPAHWRMTEVPTGSTLVVGSPPSWPVVRKENVWIMPGVPEVFRMKLAVIKEELPRSGGYRTHSVYTLLDEGTLAPLLEAVVAAFPEVEVGSYPKWFDPSYKTKLTFDGLDAEKVEAACQHFLHLLPVGEPQKIEVE